jgi:D-amino-acid dehydrogenase
MENENMDCGWKQDGLLLIHRDQADMKAYEQVNEKLLKPYNVGARHLPKSMLREMEPALHESVCGAWHHENDSHVRPDKLIKTLKKVILKDGVEIEENCGIEGFSTGSGSISRVLTNKGAFSADSFVLAAGAWSPMLAGQLSLHLPIQPAKGYSITMKRPETSPRIPCYFSEAYVVATPWRDDLRLGGTLELSGYNTRLEKARIKSLRAAADIYLNPFESSEVEEEWTGWRPMSPDDLPIIGRPRSWRNLVIASGHGMLGLTMATGTGRIVSSLIGNKNPDIDITPFRPDRF